MALGLTHTPPKEGHGSLTASACCSVLSHSHGGRVSREGIPRSPAGAARLVAYLCFGFCGLVAIFFGLLFVLVQTSAMNREYLGAVGMMAAITLPIPTACVALLGVVLSLFLRRPRALLLLAGLTALTPIWA